MKRSILTEKVARRGYHLSREYAVDPLEVLFVREVMRKQVVALSASSTLAEVRSVIGSELNRKQRLLPVVDEGGKLAGVLTRGDIREFMEKEGPQARVRQLGELALVRAVEAYPDEPLRTVVYRMAEKGFTRMPVVDPLNRKFLGIVALDDLLKARVRDLKEERNRERPLKVAFFLPGGRLRRETAIERSTDGTAKESTEKTREKTPIA
jgi:CBS domain-containing protein